MLARGGSCTRWVHGWVVEVLTVESGNKDSDEGWMMVGSCNVHSKCVRCDEEI